MLIGVSGAINTVNLPGWVSYLRQEVCENIKVILTDQASKFVNEKAVSLISGNPTYLTDRFDLEFPAAHLSLPNWADIFLVLPASANIIGKVANGIADDLLTSAILASNCPVVFYPCMNKSLWEKKALQKNLAKIEENGHFIVYHEEPMLEVATGRTESGIGVNIPKIKFDIHDLLSRESISISEE